MRCIGQKSGAPDPIFFVLTEFELNGTDVGSRFRRINRFRIDFSGQRIDPSEERMRASAMSCGAMARGTYWPLEVLSLTPGNDCVLVVLSFLYSLHNRPNF